MELEYHYDEASNRVKAVVDGATKLYQVGKGNRLLVVTGAEERSFEYDSDGAMVKEEGPQGTKLYSYVARERMVQAELDSGTWVYQYDHRAWRVGKESPGGQERFYFRDSRTWEEWRKDPTTGEYELAQQSCSTATFTPWLYWDQEKCYYYEPIALSGEPMMKRSWCGCVLGDTPVESDK